MGCGPNLRINSTSKRVALNRVVVQPKLLIKDNQEGENNYWVRGLSLFTKGEIFRADYFPSQETTSNTGNRKRILQHDDIKETNEDFIVIKNFDPLAAISQIPIVIEELIEPNTASDDDLIDQAMVIGALEDISEFETEDHDS
ncbi:hypothetical protein LguiB_009439 [Lonicera macranthoides]